MKLNQLGRRALGSLLAGALAITTALALGAGAASANEQPGQHNAGAVYTLSNAAAGNEVVVFNRSADGNLTLAGSFPTGGLGSGDGLGSQGSLVLSHNGRWLFAVNAGSNEISVFEVTREGLRLTSRTGSGGLRPISLTYHRNLLYVLNAGGSGNITGFELSRRGQLKPIPGSTQPLSNNNTGAAPGPAQIQFGPWGDVLIVTEKTTNLILTYAVDDEDGVAMPPVIHPSSGQTPFGFDISRRGVLVVSEAFGGAANASALSSYDLAEEELEVISSSIGTNQTAACWVVITRNGRYAYTTNTGSGSISGYRIQRDGTLSLLNPDGRTGVTGDGSSPIDMALSKNSKFLYALNNGSDSISAFQVHADGSLVPVGNVGGLAPAGVGLAAR